MKLEYQDFDAFDEEDDDRVRKKRCGERLCTAVIVAVFSAIVALLGVFIIVVAVLLSVHSVWSKYFLRCHTCNILFIVLGVVGGFVVIAGAMGIFAGVRRSRRLAIPFIVLMSLGAALFVTVMVLVILFDENPSIFHLNSAWSTSVKHYPSIICDIEKSLECSGYNHCCGMGRYSPVSRAPTPTPRPTARPTRRPTAAPTRAPTSQPTSSPSSAPLSDMTDIGLTSVFSTKHSPLLSIVQLVFLRMITDEKDDGQIFDEEDPYANSGTNDNHQVMEFPAPAATSLDIIPASTGTTANGNAAASSSTSAAASPSQPQTSSSIYIAASSIEENSSFIYYTSSVAVRIDPLVETCVFHSQECVLNCTADALYPYSCEKVFRDDISQDLWLIILILLIIIAICVILAVLAGCLARQRPPVFYAPPAELQGGYFDQIEDDDL